MNQSGEEFSLSLYIWRSNFTTFCLFACLFLKCIAWIRNQNEYTSYVIIFALASFTHFSKKGRASPCWKSYHGKIKGREKEIKI